MSQKITRRSFIKTGAAIGAGSLVGSSILTDFGCGKKQERVDISVVKGADYFENTIKAVEQLGGMNQFVPKDSKVALLPNVQRNNPGVFTKPEILRAVIQMCKKAGAKEISCLSWLGEQNWESTELLNVIDEEGAKLVLVDRDDESQYKPISIANGIALKEAQIMKEFFNYDVFINMPITKDHAGNKFTGTLKNLMGLNYRKSNRTFHKENWQTDINSITHLDQSIADLNTVIKPDLCIVDATEFITTNGPFGPGELIKPQKVVAGTDRVAIDSYCCTLWGLKANDIIMINKAKEHGLGMMDLNKIKINEVAV